jgi:hypothetical protein
MNVYEHGIAADSDEWGGSLRLVSSTALPVYWGVTQTIVDLEGRSLNERAVQLGRVNGASLHPADYFEESDVRYCVLATLYHLNRLIDLYVELTQIFEKIHPPGTASSGNTGDSRVANSTRSGERRVGSTNLCARSSGSTTPTAQADGGPSRAP